MLVRKPSSVERRLNDPQHRVFHSRGHTTGARLHGHDVLVHSPIDQDI